MKLICMCVLGVCVCVGGALLSCSPTLIHVSWSGCCRFLTVGGTRTELQWPDRRFYNQSLTLRHHHWNKSCLYAARTVRNVVYTCLHLCAGVLLLITCISATLTGIWGPTAALRGFEANSQTDVGFIVFHSELFLVFIPTTMTEQHPVVTPYFSHVKLCTK